MEIDKEFKEALSHLPAKEKDKLVLKLLRKDDILAKSLYFELVSGQSIEDRRSDLEKKLDTEIKSLNTNFYSPGYLMMDMRYLSGDITHHVKITKDKYGEIELNLMLIAETLQLTNSKLVMCTYNESYTFCIYCIKKIFGLLVLIKAFDEDYQADFHTQLEKIGRLFLENPPLMKVSIYNGLDVNWLIETDIPDNIKQQQQHLKAQGYLK